ncbi:MAG: DUF504 domain-containing protein [Proteobacteria bacterium]|nr:DUF504 domain-containing protein [Pseudomonadota bacterium]
MQPLHDLLSRRRWDPDFGRGEFWLGYWDRVSREIVRVPLRDAIFEADNRFSFTLVGPGGRTRRVPFHRVRRVWRDGELLWSRDS